MDMRATHITTAHSLEHNGKTTRLQKDWKKVWPLCDCNGERMSLDSWISLHARDGQS